MDKFKNAHHSNEIKEIATAIIGSKEIKKNKQQKTSFSILKKKKINP